MNGVGYSGWHIQPPSVRTSAIVFMKGWHVEALGTYFPTQKRPWCIAGRWYPREEIIAWVERPKPPVVCYTRPESQGTRYLKFPEGWMQDLS